MTVSLQVRPLRAEDAEIVAAAFTTIGWEKPASQFRRYWDDQQLGHRDILVAETGDERIFAGYLAVCWASFYPPFRDAGIPEIIDFNVLIPFRRRGIGTALMDEAERRIAERSAFAGIGVGMTPDYGPAQRMYGTRGYLPDGRGLTTTGDRFVQWGETVRVDDDLVLHLIKYLR